MKQRCKHRGAMQQHVHLHRDCHVLEWVSRARFSTRIGVRVRHRYDRDCERRPVQFIGLTPGSVGLA